MINLRGWIVISLVCLMWAGAALAHDHGRTDPAWEETTPEIKEWYSGLRQPDNPTASCCGESDAYFCDQYYSRAGTSYCHITDTRDDALLKRPHIAVGTEIEIPERKLKWDRGNPVGHAIVFLSSGGSVFCFVQNGGV